MSLRSMARILALCLAACVFARPSFADEATASSANVPPESAAAPESAPYSAWQSNAPHAPPPPIVLAPAPAPELPVEEYARRPFELTAEFMLGFASCADGTANDARCSGLSAGPGAGLTALWRVSPYFAFGGALGGVGFGFRPAATTELSQARASGVFYGLLGRAYFFDHGLVEPYLELGLGGGSLSSSARESDGIRYDETASGAAIRVGGAVEFFMSRHVRVGPAFAWTRFELSHLRRCDGSDCAGLDEAEYGHGNGFTTLSVRLSILLGPGL